MFFVELLDTSSTVNIFYVRSNVDYLHIVPIGEYFIFLFNFKLKSFQSEEKIISPPSHHKVLFVRDIL